MMHARTFMVLAVAVMLAVVGVSVIDADDSDAATITVSITSNNTNYGTVSDAYVAVASGATWTTSGNTLTFSDGTTVTASPAASTSDNYYTYTYSLSSWSPSSGTVTSSTSITANFTQTATPRYYTVTISPNNSSYGSVSTGSISVDYGTTWTTSGNTLTFSDGTTVTASPAATSTYYHYSFDSWSPSSGTVTETVTITANFSRGYNTWTFDFDVNNSNYGSVSPVYAYVLNGATWHANGNTLYFSDGTTVTASPAASTSDAQYTYTYSFSSWSPDSGTVTAPTTITANFTRTATPNTYAVTISPNNSNYGSVSPSSLTAAYGVTWSSSGDTLTFSDGQTVTATPATSTSEYTYSFSSWSPSSGTVTETTTITANFTRSGGATYQVDISPNNSNYGSVSDAYVSVTSGTTWAASGSSLTFSDGTTVTASPAASTSDAQYTYTYSFSSWSPSSGTVTSSTSITANFTRTATPNTYAVTISPNNSNYGSVSPSSLTAAYGVTWSSSGDTLTFSDGTSVTATPETSTSVYTYSFSSWSPSSGTVTETTTITANFTRSGGATYQVDISPNNSNYGSVSDAYVSVDYGTTWTTSGNTLTFSDGQTVVASPAATIEDPSVTYTFYFDSWSPSSGTVTSSTSITAVFDMIATQKSYGVTIASNNTNYGTVSPASFTKEFGTTWTTSGNTLTFADGTTVTATPTAATSQYVYSLSSWSPSSGTVTETTTITANFIRTGTAMQVDIDVNNSNYGSVSDVYVSVDYGVTWSSSGNTLTFSDGQTVVASPAASTSDQYYTYTYSLDSWSPASGTVTAATTITANFIQTSAPRTYEVTIQANNDNYGTVSLSGLSAAFGLTWSSSGDTLTFSDGTSVTATPATSTPQYTYSFSSWSPSSGTVTETVTITAIFTRVGSAINVDIEVNNSNYGSVSDVNVSVDYGVTWSSSGNTLTFSDGQTVTASPAASTSDQYYTYTYSLDSWSPASGTVTAATTITANFKQTATPKTYEITIEADPASYGTVSPSTLTVAYEVTWSSSGNTLTFSDGQTVTATPATDTEYYTYEFDSWSPASGTVTETATITASFIRSDAMVYWTNNLYNGTIDILVQWSASSGNARHNMTMDLYSGTVNNDLTTTWTASGYALTVSESFNGTAAITASLTYNGSSVVSDSVTLGKWTTYVITIDSAHGTVSATPVKVFNSFIDYTLYDSQTKTVLDFSDHDGMTVNTIQHGTGSGTRPTFSVVSTSVFMETYGQILNNPSINVYDYFPQYGSVRLNFYSFALYGDSITVNGTTYELDGANVTVEYANDSSGDHYIPSLLPDETVRTKTLELSNIYVTWDGGTGHCYLTFVNNRFTIDMGSYTAGSETVSFSGIWYFTTQLYEPKQSMQKELGSWETLPDLDKNQMCLIFIALLIILGAIAYVRFRPTVFDTAIIGGAIAIAIIILGS